MKPAEGGVLLLGCPRTAVRLVDAVRGLRRMVMAITMPVVGVSRSFDSLHPFDRRDLCLV